MRNTLMRLSIFLGCISAVMTMLGCGDNGADKRQTIYAAERALAVLEVQNTMSKHAYYYSAGKILEEYEDIWVKEEGKFADTASKGDIVGIAKIKEMFVGMKGENEKKALFEMSKIYPEIKNVPENLGVGTDLVIHTQTTPIIEIAGDGKTAKGVWYSLGIGLTPHFNDGKVDISGIFFWEKYGVDFVKEDGKWKIWHMQMVYDFLPAIDSKWTDIDNPNAPTMGNSGWRPETWSPKSIPIIAPRLPEPYYTFSDTFSYGPPFEE